MRMRSHISSQPSTRSIGQLPLRLRIAQVVPLHVAVPPRKYGGTERVVHNLAEALVRLGQDVTLFATGNSTTSAQLISMREHDIFFDSEVDAAAHHVAMLHEIYTRYASDFDVIHSHLDYMTLPFLHLTHTPTVLTLHGRLDKPEWRHVFGEYPDKHYVSISYDQRRHLSVPDMNWIATVYHGLDIESFTFYARPGDYLCFVGRMSAEKRPDLAIAVAKRCGIKLKVAAKVDHKEEEYFKKRILPLMDHPLIEWLGEVDEPSKRELMGNALALLMPIDWPEPFGMAFIEALACGTPVITCPHGSVPEILRDGLTGFSGCTEDELVAAVKKLPFISRQACRTYARRRFDRRRMALDYMRVYTQVLGRHDLLGQIGQLGPFAPGAADDAIGGVALP